MLDEDKTKDQLIIELHELRRRVAESEKDQAEHKREEAALAESEERFKLFCEQAPLAYQSLDENGCLIEVNQTWLKVLGYAKEEVIGRNFADFLHPDWVNHFKENFPRFKAVGEVLGVEFEMVKKDGSTMLVSFNGKIGRDSQGRFKQTHCIFENIIERKRSEEALAASEEMFRLLVESAPDAILVQTRGIWAYANPEAMKLFGACSKDQLIEKPVMDTVHPSDRETVRARIHSANEQKKRVPAREQKYIVLDGTIVDVETSAVPIRYENED